MKKEHDARKAKMRAYYQANKNKWKRYAKKARSKLTEADREKIREYKRAHYAANRERIIARTSGYQRKHAQWSKQYRADWYQANKKRVGERRKTYYHQVDKPRRIAAKSMASFMTVSEASELLGAKLRTFREFVYRGQIAAVRSPGGRYMIARQEVERLRDNIKHLPKEVRDQLGLEIKETSK